MCLLQVVVAIEENLSGAVARGCALRSLQQSGSTRPPMPRPTEGLDLVTTIDLLLEAGFVIDEAQLAEPSEAPPETATTPAAP